MAPTDEGGLHVAGVQQVLVDHFVEQLLVNSAYLLQIHFDLYFFHVLALHTAGDH